MKVPELRQFEIAVTAFVYAFSHNLKFLMHNLNIYLLVRRQGNFITTKQRPYFKEVAVRECTVKQTENA